MALKYLEFDLSEDADGLRTWDALASPPATHTPALLAEVHALLAHLQGHLGPSGPLDDGHGWDMDLQLHDASGRPLALDTPGLDGQRITLALSLGGGSPLAECLSAFAGGEAG